MILNPFPDLFSLSFFAPFLLRLMLGVWLLSSAYRHVQSRHGLENRRFFLWCTVLSKTIVGILLIAGLWTQIAALLAALIALEALFVRRRVPLLAEESPWFYLFILAISFSLLVLGAGAFAFDVPL
ncbi:hypothetical protein A3D66_01770 [Candidatus Kaiserbacteria bacterium RIFCSPHIGHO2_02_FULL_50_9]|uniref:Uncharacterized protein n=1 Tax=Candidatus Kaiserbacteria bacterium RIFCSPLOWO2_01_FULL_51_21 TaxID=1798508 RepID=A0A1F6EEK1_9BACT|nr:MAG: hypothetical protein A2761_02445 [Candidatus Kaiserbacteria bacterium RIFCSPHIGHO2_01_FULL_51_33]OGG63756.1 MAG: hypothetical protein A3D66_01770 [Candidatus Kaiserbacteria bacterium RIFCSPHIGHO2_02_FULL_50_9]OGG71642.1 MAG: hypothetical protein A3A35_00535 [Candidatus Kaiserbacteria bacterium RIFCSPLOWO2_01_FULL_51_21]